MTNSSLKHDAVIIKDAQDAESFKRYLTTVATILKQMFDITGNPIGSLPLGFTEWYRKHGARMLYRLFCAEFRGRVSDKFLDELDYYTMILKDDINEDTQNDEAVCSDLVASITNLSKLIILEPYFVRNNFLPEVPYYIWLNKKIRS